MPEKLLCCESLPTYRVETATGVFEKAFFELHPSARGIKADGVRPVFRVRQGGMNLRAINDLDLDEWVAVTGSDFNRNAYLDAAEIGHFAVAHLPHYLAALSEAARAQGQPAEGLDVLADAMAIVERTDERYFEAELHRLQGELLLARSPGDHGPAESAFQKALSVARAQQARSLELRAATSLARLWQAQGKTTAARDLLAPVYQSFSEGFDTPDLKSANALLDELS
jgi:hypothetical protein